MYHSPSGTQSHLLIHGLTGVVATVRKHPIVEIAVVIITWIRIVLAVE
jgi:hypothetical protein